MTKTSFDQQHFTGIQTLRGLAAIMVVLEHIRFLACGAFGVDIFFCISGFMIMHSTHDNTACFLRKRLLRIVPFYTLVTVGSYVLMVLFPFMFEQSTASWDKLIKSLLFIPFDMGGGILQPLLRIGWTVNCEMFFYLLFYVAFHISHRYRGLLCSSFLFGCVLIGTLVSGGATMTGATAPVSSWLAPIYFYGSPVMLEFALGILCYYIAKALYQRMYSCQSRAKTSLGSILLIAAIVLFIAMTVSISQLNILGYRRVLYWGLPAMLLVLLFCIAGIFLTMPRGLIRLGDISFSLYLVHYYPIMLLDRKVFDFSTLTAGSAAGAALGILLVLLLAVAAWYFIEKKLTGWLRKRFLPTSS